MVTFPRGYFMRSSWQLFHYHWQSQAQLRGIGIALNDWRFSCGTSKSVFAFRFGPLAYVTVDLRQS